jgi:hypothetical protein
MPEYFCLVDRIVSVKNSFGFIKEIYSTLIDSAITSTVVSNALKQNL